MRTFHGLLLLVLSFYARAADWEYVTATGASNVYADLGSVKSPSGNSKSAWFLFDHLDTRYDTDSARVFKSSIHLIEIGCATKRLQWFRIEMYAGPLATGTKVGARNTDNQAASYMESVQDSAREAMAASICE